MKNPWHRIVVAPVNKICMLNDSQVVPSDSILPQWATRAVYIPLHIRMRCVRSSVLQPSNVGAIKYISSDSFLTRLEPPEQMKLHVATRTGRLTKLFSFIGSLGKPS